MEVHSSSIRPQSLRSSMVPMRVARRVVREVGMSEGEVILGRWDFGVRPADERSESWG